MSIKQLFKKDINRNIQGVIKVGQDDIQNKKQELEEYVVTDELNKHFSRFFSQYRRSIEGTTDAMGVWISGFFGSGKSHFLKILSYLLENKEVAEKKPIDYFLDDEKFTSPALLADIQKAMSISTDVILFNIDSRSNVSSKSDATGLIEVFKRMFDEMRGFSSENPYLADLESRLTDEGYYEAFKDTFEKNYGQSWYDVRQDVDFIQQVIIDTVVEIGAQSEKDIDNYFVKAASQPYHYVIKEFAKNVKKYIDSKGDNHHVVFLVDEIGQYIGSNSNLMLNLQTISEDLGTLCEGKVWLVVTSQQDIDSITKTPGNDFSKIQGRFDTRLSLTSGNVQEVIQKRILQKTEEATEQLESLYAEKETVLKNLLIFDDTVEKKTFRSAETFAQVYPFIPYQFNLIGDVLTSIRKHGASGKHLSEGERSMLAIFQESLKALQDTPTGVLVPFHLTYNALQQFLDHSHSNVITRALKNELINPEQEEDCFNVNVLKILFLIKYVDKIESTIENITTLMVSQINEDRTALREKVKDALEILEKQTLIQRNHTKYVFLTDEEQEINREINGKNVDRIEVTRELSELIFDELYTDKHYVYPKYKGNYRFQFNQVLDRQPHKTNQNAELTVKILSPESDERYSINENALSYGRTLLVVLPEDMSYIEEIETALRIEKFLKDGNTSNLRDYDEIKSKKQRERDERRQSARKSLEEALPQSTFYINGDLFESDAREFKSKMNGALDRLVNDVYHKFYYLDTPMTDADVQTILSKKNQQMHFDGIEDEYNKKALEEIKRHIEERQERKKQQVTLKSILDHFQSEPYGFKAVDIEWMVAKLFVSGEINLQLNKAYLSIVSSDGKDLYQYLTKVAYAEKLIVEKRKKINEQAKKILREVSNGLFGNRNIGNDDDEMMLNFKRATDGLLQNISLHLAEYKIDKPYPGKEVLENGKKLLKKVVSCQTAVDLFNYVNEQKDELLDFGEDYVEVRDFFEKGQVKIFNQALEVIRLYEESQTYVEDDDHIQSKIKEIQNILSQAKPYRDIPKLPVCRNEFHDAYLKHLEQRFSDVAAVIKIEEETVKNAVEASPVTNETMERSFDDAFKDLLKRAQESHHIRTLLSYKEEATQLRENLLKRLARREQELQQQIANEQAAKEKQAAASQTTTAVPPIPVVTPKVKQNKTLSVRNLGVPTQWRIESKEDIQKYIIALEKQLEQALEEDTILYFNF